MKKRRSSLLQKMIAVLLSVVLVVCIVWGEEPINAQAKENVTSLEGDESEESASKNTAEAAEKETEPETSEGKNPEGQEEAATESAEEAATESAEEAVTESTEEAVTESTEEAVTESMEEAMTEGTEEAATESTEEAATEQHQSVMLVAEPAPQADNIASGTGWVLDGNGKLTISSNEGCTAWISVKGQTRNGSKLSRQVTSAEIESGVTDIAANTFNDCRSLESITIPESVKSIGSWAFWSCESLKSITIPEGVASIEENTFYYCSSLESITIPESVKSIGSNAFSCCKKLTGITIPEGVTSIEDYTFAHCHSLKNIRLPEGVTKIGEGAFSDCQGLESIAIPEGVTGVWKGIFFNCHSLESITIPEGVTGIESNTFSECSSLESITIPEGVTSIGYNAFSLCSSLKSITIPESVTSIEYNAFYGCSSLESITIPEGVTTIKANAFNECSKLTAVTMQGEEPPVIGTDVFYSCGFVRNNVKGILVPKGKVQTYKNAWTAYQRYIAEEHKHNDVTFTEWTATDSLPDTAGNYYLTENVTLSAAWNVPSGETTLCLNGKTIKQTTEDVWAVSIGSGSTLKLYDCGEAGKITREGHGYNAGSVSVGNGGTFYMYGGNISGNTSYHRPAVYVYRGEFHMSGGKIADNINKGISLDNDNIGGGVNVHNGTFYMEGGEISRNSGDDDYRGGVYVVQAGVFYMSGGKISENKSGVVVFRQAAFHMSGGEVSDNTGSYYGGVHILGTMTAGGNIVITGNTGSEGEEKNLFIQSGVIRIDTSNPLAASANIGVTTSTAPTEGSPVNITEANDADYSGHFHSDNADYKIVNGKNNVVQLAVASTDTQPPTGEIEIATGNLSSASWTEFLAPDKVAFNLFFKDRKWVTIASSDEGGSGVYGTHYYVSNDALTKAQVEALDADAWTADATVILEPEPDRKCIVYAKITDGAGNVTYLSSDGLVFDGTAPVISGVTGGETYYTSQEITVTDANLKSVAVNGTEVTLQDGVFALEAETGEQTIVATDKAGNTTTVTVIMHVHSYGTEWKNDATSHWHVCACGEKSEATAHNFGEWITDREATESDTGEKHRTCQICSYEEKEVIPAMGERNAGKFDMNVQKDEKVPETQISTSSDKLEDIVLTAEEKKQMEAGTDVKIVLDVKDASYVSSTDKTLVETALNSNTAAKGFAVGQYLDISLFKIIGENRSAISKTNGKITITIAVPESLKNTDSKKTRTYAVMRVHDGKAELLNDMDNSVDTITIETDRFSIYAIVYKDASKGSTDKVPDTADYKPVELAATLAMITGFSYLLLYFANRRRGMTEETKQELVSRIVMWAKQGGKIRRMLALAAVFVLLAYYHSIGKKICAEWKEIYED